jgi:hypothetical protein
LKSLDLSGSYLDNYLGNEGAAQIAGALGKMTCVFKPNSLVSANSNVLLLLHRALASLHVGSNAIPEGQIRTIIAMDKLFWLGKLDYLCAVPVKIAHLKLITELDLAGRSLGAEGAVVLSAGLKDATALSVLNLSSNNLQAEGAVVLSAALNDAVALSDLNLSNNYITNGGNDMSGVIAFADALKHDNASHLRGAIELFLSECGQNFERSIRNNPGTSSNSEYLAELAAFKETKEKELSHNIFLSADDLHESWDELQDLYVCLFAACLAGGGSTYIQVPTGQQCSDSTVGHDFETDSDEEEFDHEEFDHLEAAVGVMSRAKDMAGALDTARRLNIKRGITKLNLSGNHLGSSFVQEFEFSYYRESGMLAFSKSMSNLKELNISNNSLHMEELQILVPAIQSNLLLASLHLGSNDIPEEQIRTIIAMDKFDYLCAVPVKQLKAGSISSLNLAGRSLGAEGALVLSAGLNDAIALSDLNLSNNNITNGGNDMSGVVAFASALMVIDSILVIDTAIKLIFHQANQIISSLNLANNHLKAEGTSFLAPALKVVSFCMILLLL